MISFQLGDVIFADFEIPESIAFGGEQLLSVHQLVGGSRVIDAMGRSDAPMEWSGRFRGADAVQRARLLDAMRIAGKPQALTWGAFAYTVIVSRFTGVFEKAFEVPYTISCIVVSDDAAPQDTGPGPSVDDMMASDAAASVDLGTDIGDAGLNTQLATMLTAVSAVPVYASASRETLAGVVAPINAVQASVAALIASNGAAVSPSSLGGVISGGAPATSAAALISNTLAMGQLPRLYDLDSRLGRMLTNLQAVNASGARQLVAGGDLGRLAASAYGDFNQWPVIALANGLSDPVLTGIQTILIPPNGPSVDGVLQP